MFATFRARVRARSFGLRHAMVQKRGPVCNRSWPSVELLEDRSCPSASLFDPLLVADVLFQLPGLSPSHVPGLISDLPAVRDQALGAARSILPSTQPPPAPTTSTTFQYASAPHSSPGVDPQLLAAWLSRSVAAEGSGRSGNPNLSPQGRAGPLVLGGNVTLTGPSYVPVNADNDNGSNVTNGLPAQRDFNVQPLANADPDLIKATLTAGGLPAGGTWTQHLTQNGRGQIRLWTDAKKSAAFTVPAGGNLAATFYIEGSHESAALGDVTLWYSYTVNGVSYPSSTLSITVTPLIMGFSVTPGADASDPNKQNIILTDQLNKNGDLGLSAQTPSLAAGVNYESVALQTGLRGEYKFVQIFRAVVNGQNGTKDANGKIVGWLNQNNSGAVMQLPQGVNYPLLDVAAGAADQGYNFDFASSTSTDKTTVTITADDFPNTGRPIINGADWGLTGIVDDLRYQPRTYIAWEWKQVAGNSGGAQVPVFYFLGYVNWQVDFYGKSPNKVAPISQVQILNGVSADANYTVSNTDPGQAALDLNKTFNNQNGWVAA